MPQLIQMAIDETATRRSGGETVLSKLAELMFVDLLRCYIDTLPKEAGGWLSGLRDVHVGAALALMHGRPAEAWTLERLAHEVGLSRSVFADRFAHFVQDTPMQYLTRWRMQLAAHLLERQGVGLAQVAAAVGLNPRRPSIGHSISAWVCHLVPGAESGTPLCKLLCPDNCAAWNGPDLPI